MDATSTSAAGFAAATDGLVPLVIATRLPGEIWLDGNAIFCACPDCRAPMSIRFWLMLADCWRCGTSIALNEEQERQVERLLHEKGGQGSGRADSQSLAQQELRPPAAPPRQIEVPARQPNETAM